MDGDPPLCYTDDMNEILPPELADLVEGFSIHRSRGAWAISGMLITPKNESVPFCADGCATMDAALRALEAAVAAASVACGLDDEEEALEPLAADSAR